MIDQPEQLVLRAALDDAEIVKFQHYDYSAAPDNVITNISNEALRDLAVKLYNKVLFFEKIFDENSTFKIPEFGDLRVNYRKYAVDLGKQLTSTCVAIERKNNLVAEADRIYLPAVDENLQPSPIVAERIRSFYAVQPGAPTRAQVQPDIDRHLNSDYFKGYATAQQTKLEQHLLQKKTQYFTVKLALYSGIKFTRKAGESATLQAQAKRMLEAFKEDMQWYEKWPLSIVSNLFQTRERKLYRKINSYVETHILDIERLSGTLSKTALKNALFDLRNTSVYTKIKNTQELKDWEKNLLQSKLIEHLLHALDINDPFIAPYIQFADNFAQTLVGKVLLFVGGLLPPFNILMAPSAKYYFTVEQCNTITDYIFKALYYPIAASYWLTYPARWVIEYGIITPLEVPFKILSAFRDATLHSNEFDPEDNWFERVKTAVSRKEFTHSTIFHETYAMQQEEQEAARIENKANSYAKYKEGNEVNEDSYKYDAVRNTQDVIWAATIERARKEHADNFLSGL